MASAADRSCGVTGVAFGSLDQDVHRPRLCAAIVDRLIFNGTIIETGTEPYRLTRTKASHDA